MLVAEKVVHLAELAVGVGESGEAALQTLEFSARHHLPVLPLHLVHQLTLGAQVLPHGVGSRLGIPVKEEESYISCGVQGFMITILKTVNNGEYKNN